jgi:hypothetical protein
MNGFKLLNVDKDERFPCTECPAVLETRKLREMHRRKEHNLREKYKEDCRRKREQKAAELLK